MKQLSTFIITALFIAQVLSCSTQNDTVQGTHFTGELYFKLISIGSFYQADSLAVKNINNYLDSLKSIHKDSLTRNDKEVISIYDGLKENGLIEKPFFHLRFDSATTYIVYADTNEYKQIKSFDRQKLINENKKIVIDLTGDTLTLGSMKVINCKTIDKVEKVEGKTYWRK